MTKSQLRKLYLDRRSRIGIAEVARSSASIADRFFREVELPPGPTVLTFIRSARTNEIDTSAIYYRLWSKRPDVAVCAPRMTETGDTFDCVTFDKHSEFNANRWGIREPIDGRIVKPADLDVVIVPLLAYDIHGNRVGYGGGYYDRLLSKCRPDCAKVGVSLFQPEPEIDDILPTDISMDMCITPRITYRY